MQINNQKNNLIIYKILENSVLCLHWYFKESLMIFNQFSCYNKS